MNQRSAHRRPTGSLLLILMVLSICLGACQPSAIASDSRIRLPDTESPQSVRVLFIGNLCAGCASDHLEQMAAALDPPRVIEVDSVAIPTY